MRSVHILGLGLVVGMVALGTMLAAVGFRWQEQNFPEGGAAASGGQISPPGSAAGSAGPQQVSQGRTLFQQRCSSCHTVTTEKKVGPGLKGVTDQRAHDWLVEFISDPDAVFARNDPIAQQLSQEYGGLKMPNTGTSKDQAENILAYIASESGGTGTAVKNPQASPGAATKPQAGATVSPPAAVKQPGAGTAGPSAPGKPSEGTGNPTAGQAVFQQNCNACHPGGNQGVGPALKGRNLPPDRIQTQVRQGGAVMPAFSTSQISDQQLSDLVAYVSQLK